MDPSSFSTEALERLVKLFKALPKRRLISFHYGNEWFHNEPLRTIEPHTIGLTLVGNLAVIGWQVSGPSESQHVPQWRMFLLEGMTALMVLSESFTGERPGYTESPKNMSKVWATLRPMKGVSK